MRKLISQFVVGLELDKSLGSGFGSDSAFLITFSKMFMIWKIILAIYSGVGSQKFNRFESENFKGDAKK